MILTYPKAIIANMQLAATYQASGPERGPAAQRRVDFEVQAGSHPGQADAWCCLRSAIQISTDWLPFGKHTVQKAIEHGHRNSGFTQ